ncbi:ankyrin repeat-containing domain protein [Daldinia bambusicola]|nr:ankyrin repeat-containing domain protein [Daldinia bambusicola]
MLQVMELLVREGVIPVDEQTSTLQSALNMLNTVNYDDSYLPAFNKLIELGADINGHRSDNLIPLTVAIQFRQWAYAEALLDAGANVTPQHKFPGVYHPIHACVWNYFDKPTLGIKQLELDDSPTYNLLTRLLRSGADLHESYPGGHTPLGCAVYHGVYSYVLYLVSIGARVNERDAAGYTPLDLFVRRAPIYPMAYIGILEALLRGGARMDTPLRGGLTLLEWTIKENNRRISSTDSAFLEELLKMATTAMLDREHLNKLLADYFCTDYYEKCLLLIKYGATLDDYDEAITNARRMILRRSEQVSRDSEVHSKYMQMIARAGLPDKSITDLIAYAQLAEDKESIQLLQCYSGIWPGYEY